MGKNQSVSKRLLKNLVADQESPSAASSLSFKAGMSGIVDAGAEVSTGCYRIISRELADSDAIRIENRPQIASN